VRVDGVDVLAELAAGCGVDLLNALETSTLDESLLGLGVLGKNLGELGGNVGKNVVRSADQEGFKRGEVSAHLDDVLQGLLGLVLKIGGALSFLHHVDGEETGRDISLGEVLGVVGRVTANLSKGPGSGGLDVVFWLVLECILEWSNALGHDHSHGEGVVEGRDVSEGHDSGETGVTLRLADVINGSGGTTRVHDELSELSSLLCDLTDASGGVLSNLDVDILKAVEDSGENLGLNNNLGEVDGVLGDLGEALTNVALKLGIWVRDEGSKVGDGSLVNNSLGKLLGVLGNLRQGSGRDTLEGELGLLDAEDKKSNGTSIDNRLSELGVVLGDTRESKSSSLLHGGIELLKTVDKSVESTGVNDSLGKVGGVLGNGSKNVSGSFLVESLEANKTGRLGNIQIIGRRAGDLILTFCSERE
jgi:hypothetical protein